jgi:hypothetical protein
MSATGMMAKQTTEIGDQFLAFISAPTAQAQNKQL